MITIVDYGLGNIRALLNAFARLKIEARTARSPAELGDATRLILPGVGHFDHAMRLLNESGMRERLDDLVLNKKVPILGICVGLQLLGGGSDEGKLPGLGWIDGRVKSLASLKPEGGLLVPHMGWNDVHPVRGNGLFKSLDTDSRFYFLHSYYMECSRPENVLAMARYGNDFACAVISENIYGVQFHPEKSHHFGTQLLSNFAQF